MVSSELRVNNSCDMFMETDIFSNQEKGGIFSWYILNLTHLLDWTTGLTLLHYKSLYHTPKFTTAPCVVELNMEAFIWPSNRTYM